MLQILSPLLLIAAVQADPATTAPAASTAPATTAAPATTEAAPAAQTAPMDEVLADHNVEVALGGSPESMARQHAVAVASGLTFVATLEEMEALAARGELVPIGGGRNYEVMDWVFPYGIPEVRTFVERLAAEYRSACGEEMVVTSLTRPHSEQLSNSHELSVHPAGMAIDLRVPQNPDCREFLEAHLLEQEEGGLVDITRERAPPHYHVALFPGPYAEWAETQPDLPGVTASLDEGAEQAAAAQDPPRGGLGWVAIVALIGVLAAVAAAWWYLRGRRGP